MPRYFFNLYDGRSDLDNVGTELRDTYEAQAQAIRFSGEILRDLGAKFWNGEEWRLEVTTENKQVLFVLRFSAEERSPLMEQSVEGEDT